jgi:hypothetical protein
LSATGKAAERPKKAESFLWFCWYSRKSIDAVESPQLPERGHIGIWHLARTRY